MSVSHPIRAATTKPFRFLDLPSEIRNQVYTILLCPFEIPKKLDHIPAELSQLDSSLELQVLRTCRRIYMEANYLMLSTNLYVQVIVRIPFEELSPLIAGRLPILRMKEKAARKFKGSVMSHEITVPAPAQMKQRTFVFLHRDLNNFCEALLQGMWRINQHQEIVSHVVTLHNPFQRSNGFDYSKFPSPNLQEALIAPYRVNLCGFCRFQFKGEINKDIRKAAISDVTRPIDKNPNAIIRQLEGQESKGNQHFKNEEEKLANKEWKMALRKIRELAGMYDAGDPIFDAGGQAFVDRLAELAFVLFSNKTQIHLNKMRERLWDDEDMEEISRPFFLAMRGAMGAMQIFPDSTWQPSNRQMGELLHRSAIALASKGSFEDALSAIQRASLTLPGDASIEAEKTTILLFTNDSED
ncbi:hypothetical protein N431DRAFT_463264 [Stipitochalara longipes BDJ]|nr:hypothetical protein N431DRAFT_463264 [Stipitochalara longipes BDJ]